MQQEKENPELSFLNESVVLKIKKHQNFYYAVTGGLLATIISAIIWAAISIATEHQIGYMAILVGVLVGFSVRFFGAGIDQKFAYLGSILSLIGCLLGNLFTQIGFIAHAYSYGYFEVLSYLSLKDMVSIIAESFSPMDLFFYSIAIFEGYKFSCRKITEDVIENEGYSPNFKYRTPLVIISIILLSVVYIKVKVGLNGPKTYNYDSGMIMSEGTLKNSKNHGKWTFYYENGNIMSTGYFNMGMRDSLWHWYTTEGKPESSGYYKNGMEDGCWMKYYENGNVLDSVCFTDGRMTGEYISRYENGNIRELGYYKLDLKDSIWNTFYENGQLASSGKIIKGTPSGDWITYFEDGKISGEISYDSDNDIIMKNIWDKNGKQLIYNGNGTYKEFSNDDQIIVLGEVKNGRKTGEWKSYSEEGKLTEEGIYENGIYKIKNVWYSDGEPMIVNGEGFYKTYYPENIKVFMAGEISRGLKTGTWDTYYESTNLMSQSEYENGKQSGPQKFFYESGIIFSEGIMQEDKQEGIWNWYHENGVLSSSAQFLNGKKEGTQVMNDESGRKIKEEYYINGELTGVKIF